MKTEIAELWADALESGEYVKQQGALVRPSSGPGGGPAYCCLGVLCHLAVAAGVPGLSEGKREFIAYGEREGGGLPRAVQDWAGVGTKVGAMPTNSMYNGEIYRTLTMLNDTLDAPFTEIARVIREKANEL